MHSREARINEELRGVLKVSVKRGLVVQCIIRLNCLEWEPERKMFKSYFSLGLWERKLILDSPPVTFLLSIKGC